MDYSGTLYVKDSEGSDYLGVVFGYQSNRKFYVVMWRRENINFGKADTNAGIKGLQLKVRITYSEKAKCTLRTDVDFTMAVFIHTDGLSILCPSLYRENVK